MNTKVQIQEYQNTKYKYRLLYRYENRVHVLATFEIPERLRLFEKYFGHQSQFIGRVSNKALEHPNGGNIYNFHGSYDLVEKIKNWFHSINADEIAWNFTIRIVKKIKSGHEILSMLYVSV